MIRGKIIIPADKLSPLALIKDSEVTGKAEYQLVWGVSSGIPTVLSFESQTAFQNALVTFGIDPGNVRDKRKNTGDELKSALNYSQINYYKKTSVIEAIQFVRGRNEGLIEKFLDEFEATWVKQSATYQIDGANNIRHQLRPGNFLVCLEKGDVYPVEEDKFLENYQSVTI